MTQKGSKGGTWVRRSSNDDGDDNSEDGQWHWEYVEKGETDEEWTRGNKGGKPRKGFKAMADGYDDWDENYWPEWTGKGGGKKAYYDYQWGNHRKGSKAWYDGRDGWNEDYWPEWTGKGGGKKGFSDDRGKGGWYYDGRGKGGNARGYDDGGNAKPGSKQRAAHVPGGGATVLELAHMYPTGSGCKGQFGWQPMPPPVPLWTKYKTADGKFYYHNSFTGLTQWEVPTLEELACQVPDNQGGSQPRTADSGRNEGDNWGDEDVGGDGRQGESGWSRKRQGAGKPQKSDGEEFGPPGCNLFVFHVPDGWLDEDLHEFFAPHGNIISAKIMKEFATGRSRGFGFVSYDARVGATTAIKKMQGYKVLGKRLKVELKKGERYDADDDPGEIDEGGEGDDGATIMHPDNERLIGYLRERSAKKKAQHLKESVDAASDDNDTEAVSGPEVDVDGANIGGDGN